ncbi:MAG TPA: phosphatase PAP2 family protein [Acidimicrobiales bacterium]
MIAAVEAEPRSPWIVVRWIALATYAVVLVLWCNAYGVPIGHDYIFIWILIGLLCACIGRTWMSIVHLLIDWGPFLLVVIAYDLSRGWADGAGFPVHFTPQIDADKLLFFGHVPTEWLQQHLYHTDYVVGFVGGHIVATVEPTVPVQWFEVVFDLTYLSHYLTSFILAAFLWVKSRARFQAYARRFATLSAFGFVTYVVFPAAPPWLAAQQGYLAPTVGRIGGRGFVWLHLHTIRNLIDTGTKTTNLVAAVPSLHAGYATLVVLTLWPSLPKWGRALLVLYPLLMGVMLVATGEHYVADIILGIAYAFGAHFLWNFIERWWEGRKDRKADVSPRSEALQPA